MNNTVFNIKENDLELATKVCKDIDDPKIRDKSAKNILAATIAKKFFNEYETDIESSICHIPSISDNIDISDIYVNGTYVDIRLYFNESECLIPKIHFEKQLLPFAYMFIKLNEDLTEGIVTGFMIPQAITEWESLDERYIHVKENDFISFNDLAMYLGEHKDVGIYDKFDLDMYNCLDDIFDNSNEFYYTLIHSKAARLKLWRTYFAKNILCGIDINAKPNNAGEYENTPENNVADDYSDFTNNNEETDLNFNITETLEGNIENLTEHEDVILDEELPLENILEDEISDNNEELLELQMNDDISIDTDNYEIVSDSNGDAEEYHENASEEIQELTDAENDNDYTTETSPSLGEIEANFAQNEQIKNGDFSKSEVQESEYSSVLEELGNENSDNNEYAIQDKKQIHTLFDKNDTMLDDGSFAKNKKTNKVIPLVCLLFLIAAAGYYGYNKYMQRSNVNIPDSITTVLNSAENKTETPTEAMPVETVEKVQKEAAQEAELPANIPLIERNLDVSGIIENLSVRWEVPADYVSNSVAKRYFTKLGKVIQFNLKTDFLLLTKPPISNKVSVELEYDNTSQRFHVKDIVASSGEPLVDNVIKETLERTLSTKFGIDMTIFEKIKSNPVIVIQL